MKRLLALFLLSVLLLTSCNNPAAPIDSETTEPTETPTDAESTTPGEVESTTPQGSESNTTEQIPPEDLLTEFPPMDYYSIGCLEQTIPLYKNPALDEIEALENSQHLLFGFPFAEPEVANYIWHLAVTMQDNFKIYRIQHITLLDEEHVCVVYRVTKEDNTKFIYRVFEKEVFDDDSGEVWNTTTEVYYLTKSFKYSDFSDFRMGDSWEKLSWIEPAYVRTDDLRRSVDESGIASCNIVLLLEDGVLHITFRCENFQEVKTREDIKSLFLATDIQFYPNGSDAEINGQPLSILKAENRPPLPGADD